MLRELGNQPCRKASELRTAAHQRIFSGNTQQSILMLKCRLKFQFQVNSKFTSEDIFSQVAVSLFILLSCSQVNSLPQIIKPSVVLRGCTIGRTLENAPGSRHGHQSPSLPPASHLHTSQSSRAATLLWAFLQPGLYWAGTPLPAGLPALPWQGGDTGEPQPYSPLTQGWVLHVFSWGLNPFPASKVNTGILFPSVLVDVGVIFKARLFPQIKVHHSQDLPSASSTRTWPFACPCPRFPTAYFKQIQAKT